jgi:hypothetical protein
MGKNRPKRPSAEIRHFSAISNCGVRNFMSQGIGGLPCGDAFESDFVKRRGENRRKKSRHYKV